MKYIQIVVILFDLVTRINLMLGSHQALTSPVGPSRDTSGNMNPIDDKIVIDKITSFLYSEFTFNILNTFKAKKITEIQNYRFSEFTFPAGFPVASTLTRRL